MDRLITAAPALICLGLMAAAGIWAVVHSLRGCLHLPAAPDNQPGANTDDLTTCRHILHATETRKEKP